MPHNYIISIPLLSGRDKQIHTTFIFQLNFTLFICLDHFDPGNSTLRMVISKKMRIIK